MVNSKHEKKDKSIPCSLIISTYNWPAALRLSLESIINQSYLPVEVLIADDGSGDETKTLIQEIKKRFPVPIIHIWHPDNGFQLSQIRNKAIAEAKGEYIIQIDGDIILHKHFVSDHLATAEKGYFLTGSRVILNEEMTKEILSKGLSIVNFQLLRKSKNLFNLFRSKFLSSFLVNRYKQSGKHRYYVKGCNMSFWKEDLFKVNGYNEEIVGWGSEDSELAARLMKIGIKKRFLKLVAIAYHLHHKTASRAMEADNEDILFKTIDHPEFYVAKGLNQYLNNH